MIDTHSHLDDDQFAGDIEAVVSRARTAGIARIVNIGYRPARWLTTIALAERFPEIAYTFGLHPHHAEEWSPACERRLLDLIAERRPVAIGEIGLDYFRNFNPPDAQRRVFARQLEIAVEAGLPVVIHQRNAESDLMGILSETPRSLACVLHSFDGTAELADFAVDRSYFVGIGGLMTRSRSAELRQVIARIPLGRMLLETDSPYLVPAKVKNQRNEPANLVKVAENLSQLLGRSEDEIAAVTTENAISVFGHAVAP